MQRPYAVRVTLTHEDGSTVTRDYVRGAVRLSQEAFASFALGDLVRLTSATPTDWTISELGKEN